MPALNDLTPEEEAMFAQHGVPSAGPGGEPVIEPGITPPAEPAPAAPAEPAPAAPAEPSAPARGPDGRFVPQAAPTEPADGSGEGGEPKMVPLAALHEARAARAEIARQLQLSNARMNAILSERAGAQPAAPQMPDLNENPAEYIQAMERRIAAFEQNRAEETQFRQIDNAIEQDEAIFSMTHADYGNASDHYVQSRARELLAFYPPEQAQQILLSEARQIAQEAWRRGQSPAEMIYTLAQARGYTPGAAPAAPQYAPAQPAPAAPARGGPRAADVVASVARGQQASRSLSSGAGASAESLNAEAILSMTDDEFNAWLGEGMTATNRFANIGS